MDVTFELQARAMEIPRERTFWEYVLKMMYHTPDLYIVSAQYLASEETAERFDERRTGLGGSEGISVFDTSRILPLPPNPLPQRWTVTSLAFGRSPSAQLSERLMMPLGLAPVPTTATGFQKVLIFKVALGKTMMVDQKDLLPNEPVPDHLDSLLIESDPGGSFAQIPSLIQTINPPFFASAAGYGSGGAGGGRGRLGISFDSDSEDARADADQSNSQPPLYAETLSFSTERQQWAKLKFPELQILPYMVCEVDFRPLRIETSLPECDQCQSVAATKYCASDNAHFCDACDASHHNVSALVATHTREAVTMSPHIFGFCVDHPSALIESVCMACHEELCCYCIMLGNHALLATSEAENHPLISTFDAFSAFVRDGHKSVLKSVRTDLAERLDNMQQEVSQLMRHLTAIFREIETLENKALQNLKATCDWQLTYMLAMRRQFDIELQALDHMNAFWRHVSQTLPPGPFLYLKSCMNELARTWYSPDFQGRTTSVAALGETHEISVHFAPHCYQAPTRAHLTTLLPEWMLNKSFSTQGGCVFIPDVRVEGHLTIRTLDSDQSGSSAVANLGDAERQREREREGRGGKGGKFENGIGENGKHGSQSARIASRSWKDLQLPVDDNVASLLAPKETDNAADMEDVFGPGPSQERFIHNAATTRLQDAVCIIDEDVNPGETISLEDDPIEASLDIASCGMDEEKPAGNPVALERLVDWRRRALESDEAGRWTKGNLQEFSEYIAAHRFEVLRGVFELCYQQRAAITAIRRAGGSNTAAGSSAEGDGDKADDGMVSLAALSIELADELRNATVDFALHTGAIQNLHHAVLVDTMTKYFSAFYDRGRAETKPRYLLMKSSEMKQSKIDRLAFQLTRQVTLLDGCHSFVPVLQLIVDRVAGSMEKLSAGTHHTLASVRSLEGERRVLKGLFLLVDLMKSWKYFTMPAVMQFTLYCATEAFKTAATQLGVPLPGAHSTANNSALEQDRRRVLTSVCCHLVLGHTVAPLIQKCKGPREVVRELARKMTLLAAMAWDSAMHSSERLAALQRSRLKKSRHKIEERKNVNGADDDDDIGGKEGNEGGGEGGKGDERTPNEVRSDDGKEQNEEPSNSFHPSHSVELIHSYSGSSSLLEDLDMDKAARAMALWMHDDILLQMPPAACPFLALHPQQPLWKSISTYARQILLFDRLAEQAVLRGLLAFDWSRRFSQSFNASLVDLVLLAGRHYRFGEALTQGLQDGSHPLREATTTGDSPQPSSRRHRVGEGSEHGEP